jgi:hypothetical protein
MRIFKFALICCSIFALSCSSKKEETTPKEGNVDKGTEKTEEKTEEKTDPNDKRSVCQKYSDFVCKCSKKEGSAEYIKMACQQAQGALVQWEKILTDENSDKKTKGEIVKVCKEGMDTMKEVCK